MAPQVADVVHEVLEQVLARHGRPGDDRLDITAERCSQFRDLAVIAGYALEAARQVGTMLAQRRVNEVFTRVVDGIRIDRHVVHDVVKEIHVGLSLVRDVPAFVFQQVQQSSEVSVILAQFVEDPGELDTHSKSTSFYHRYHACRASGG